MKKLIVSGICAILSIIMIIRTSAQEVAPTALTEIQKLVGAWEGNASLTLDGKNYTFPYYMTFRLISDGKGLSMDEWFEHTELGKLMGTNLIGFNANDNMIHWFSVDNFGTTHDHKGFWKSKDNFYMEAREIVGKAKLVEKIDLRIKSNDKMEITLTATMDGKEFEKLTGTFQRIQNH